MKDIFTYITHNPLIRVKVEKWQKNNIRVCIQFYKWFIYKNFARFILASPPPKHFLLTDYWKYKKIQKGIITGKRHEEIPQGKMFNPNLYKNKSYDMNFIHIYELHAFITCIKSIKFMSYDLLFYKFGLDTFLWGISSCLFECWRKPTDCVKRQLFIKFIQENKANFV